MFLATTALEQFWDTRQPLLFLGEWCRLYSRRHVWERLPHEVLPYHWQDRRRLLEDFGRLNRTYEWHLADLADRLNELHGVKWSVRYWRIVIGPWLRYFTEILYDRYRSLAVAEESLKVSDCWLGQVDEITWVPTDFGQFEAWLATDEFNQYLYTVILELLETVPSQRLDIPVLPPRQRGHRRKWRDLPDITSGLLFRALARASDVLPRLHGIAFDASTFSPRDLLMLQYAMRQFMILKGPKVRAADGPIDLALRRRFVRPANDATDEFEWVLSRLIARAMPKAYIEDYQRLRHASMQALPRKPTAILTALAYYGDEAFKFWAAEQCERGTPLLVAQHGGLYGLADFSSAEDHEVLIADRYITWGWEGSYTKMMPLPASLLKSIQWRARRNHGAIFWNLNLAPRYSYRLYSSPIGPQWIDYIAWQIAFARQLKAAVFEKLICRPYWVDYGWNIADRIREAVPAVKFDSGRAFWSRCIRDAALAIETTNFTTLLQSFAAGVPTIVTMQPDVWGLRPQAAEIFAELADVGVYFTDPTRAAAKVNEVYEDPWAWWMEPAVQKARDRFCRCYARRSDTWLHDWKTALAPFTRDGLALRGSLPCQLT